MTKKCRFHTSFCQIPSENNPKFPPTGGHEDDNYNETTFYACEKMYRLVLAQKGCLQNILASHSLRFRQSSFRFINKTMNSKVKWSKMMRLLMWRPVSALM